MMSLSAREQKDLDSIAVTLAADDPRLASLLGMFGQLTVDEEPPLRGRIGVLRLRAARGRHRRQSRRRRRPADRKLWRRNLLRVALLVWFLVLIGLLASTILSRFGSAECVHPGMAACVTREPARAPLRNLGK